MNSAEAHRLVHPSMHGQVSGLQSGFPFELPISNCIDSSLSLWQRLLGSSSKSETKRPQSFAALQKSYVQTNEQNAFCPSQPFARTGRHSAIIYVSMETPLRRTSLGTEDTWICCWMWTIYTVEWKEMETTNQWGARNVLEHSRLHISLILKYLQNCGNKLRQIHDSEPQWGEKWSFDS